MKLIKPRDLNRGFTVWHQTYLHLYTLGNIPVEVIRLWAKDAVLSKRRRWPFAVVWSGLLQKSDVWPVDPLTFSKKNPSRAIPRSTYIHPPSLAKIRQRTSEEWGGPTDRQTDKCCSIYSMIIIHGNSKDNFIFHVIFTGITHLAGKGVIDASKWSI